jgi:hypothetical protein
VGQPETNRFDFFTPVGLSLVQVSCCGRLGKPACLRNVFVFRMWSEDLSTIQPQLAKAGISIHGVGTSMTGLDEFQGMQFLKGSLYVDEGGEAYAALNFKELGFMDGFGLLSPSAHAAYAEARRRRVPGNMEEASKGMQLGGTLVIAPSPQPGGKPRIVFMHAQTGFADQPDPQDILKAALEALGGESADSAPSVSR